jgi:hypothetical protein
MVARAGAGVELEMEEGKASKRKAVHHTAHTRSQNDSLRHIYLSPVNRHTPNYHRGGHHGPCIIRYPVASHRDTGLHFTASASSPYPLTHAAVNVSRTTRAQSVSSHWASRADPFCSTERKLPLAPTVVPMWSHSWPTATPLSTRASRFDVAVRLQRDVPGVLNVMLRPITDATVLTVCVNRFARSAAALSAYQATDAIRVVCRIRVRWRSIERA